MARKRTRSMSRRRFVRRPLVIGTERTSSRRWFTARPRRRRDGSIAPCLPGVPSAPAIATKRLVMSLRPIRARKVCGSARASKKTMTLTKGCAGALPRRGGEVTWIRSLRRFRRASAGGASSAVRRIKANAVSRDMGAGGYGIGHAPATPFRRTTLPAPLGQHGECDIVRKGPGLLVGLAERRRLWEAGLAETVRLYPVELAGRNEEDVVRTSPPGAVHIRSAAKASVRPAAALRD